MLGIIVCTHSDFAAGIKNAVEMIAGSQENFDVITFDGSVGLEDLAEEIRERARLYVEKKDSVAVFVDMFGATPCNASLYGLSEFSATVVTGVNMPVLLETVIGREDCTDYDALLSDAAESAKEGIKVVRTDELK